MTTEIKETDIDAAIVEIEALGVVEGDVVRIRAL